MSNDSLDNEQNLGGTSEKVFKFMDNSLPESAEDHEEESEEEVEGTEEEEEAEEDESTSSTSDKNTKKASTQNSSINRTDSGDQYRKQQARYYEQDAEGHDDEVENLGASLLNDMNVKGSHSKRHNNNHYSDDHDDDDEYDLDTAARPSNGDNSSTGDSSFRSQYKEKREQRRRIVGAMVGGAAGLVMIGPCTAVAAGIGGAMLIKRLDKKRKENVKKELREDETETASLLSPKAQV